MFYLLQRRIGATFGACTRCRGPVLLPGPADRPDGDGYILRHEGVLVLSPPQRRCDSDGRIPATARGVVPRTNARSFASAFHFHLRLVKYISQTPGQDAFQRDFSLRGLAPLALGFYRADTLDALDVFQLAHSWFPLAVYQLSLLKKKKQNKSRTFENPMKYKGGSERRAPGRHGRA